MTAESIDGSYGPFKGYMGYSLMAPCYRDCNNDVYFNVRALLL